MRMSMECSVCGERDIEYLGDDMCLCPKCGTTPIREFFIMSPYERTRAAVCATGNKWAIENLNATH